MWGSALIDDDFGEVQTFTVTPQPTTNAITKQFSFSANGDGWFETHMNCNADNLVKRLRKARRYNKENKDEIDKFIEDVRLIKALETELTLQGISWATPFYDTMKNLGLSDRKLKSLRKFGESRQVSLQQACLLWEKAEQTLKMLDEHEDAWGIEEQQAWASAMQDRTSARKMWTSSLHHMDKLTKQEQDFLHFAAKELTERGPMKAVDIQLNASEADLLTKAHTARKLSTLLNMYGEEVDIVKGAHRGTYVKIGADGLILKDPWSYSAGFLDADGYITITERGEPRAGMIATGERGKVHCEDLFKTLECGVLQTDNKVYKNSNRSQHRLQFYSKSDLRKLLNGVSPYLKMKSLQARAVLAYLDEKDNTRKEELKRLVRFENWKDDRKKSSALLNSWGIDEDTIDKYRGESMMAEEEREGVVSRFLSALASPFRRRTTPQPQMPLYTTGIQEPVLAQGITLPALYAVSNENLILRTVITKLGQEIFRRGYYWEKKFRAKCVECEEEFQHDVDVCPSCGGGITKPDPEQVMYAKWLLNGENSMEQTFMQVLHEVERDLNIVDDAFIILIKEYYVDEKTGDVQFYRIKEILRGDPIFMRIIADKRGVRGGRYKICRIHRDQVAYPGQEPKCSVCGSRMVDAHYVNMAGSGKNQYYTKGEVIHLSKYNPSKLYGKSPVNTLWRQAMTLTAMDNYIYTAYQKRRIPKGIISVTTDNLESMKSFWKGVDEKMERDPHYIPKVGIESNTGRGGVNWVKFMDTLEEMQYIAVRDEIRNRIAAFYGVSSIFMIDNGKSGGLNNEGLQILVTNRAVEYGQKVYTDVLFPRILRELDVTDWKITLYPNEEEDEITRLRRDEMEVNLAQRMAMLGYKPELMEEGERDVRFTYKKLEEQPQAPAQPQPGMPPGMPPGGMMPPRQSMPPQAQQMMHRNALPPQMMQQGMPQGMPPSQPGGEGMGIRTPRTPARPQQRGSAGAGAPVSSVQQRGLQPSIQQRNQQALMNGRRLRGA